MLGGTPAPAFLLQSHTASSTYRRHRSKCLRDRQPELSMIKSIITESVEATKGQGLCPQQIPNVAQHRWRTPKGSPEPRSLRNGRPALLTVLLCKACACASASKQASNVGLHVSTLFRAIDSMDDASCRYITLHDIASSQSLPKVVARK
jgi:hypothetical protein